jgi:hypothetical protein
MWITSVREQGAPLRQSISLGAESFIRLNQRTATGSGPILYFLPFRIRLLILECYNCKTTSQFMLNKKTSQFMLNKKTA